MNARPEIQASAARFPNFSDPAPTLKLVREPSECFAPAEIGIRLAAAIPPSDRYGRITFADFNALASLLAAAAEFGSSAALKMMETGR